MGDGAYISTASASRSAVRALRGDTGFHYDEAVRAGRASGIHESLDLTKKPTRESLDVPGKAPATPILVFLDVTGSMAHFPKQVIANLHTLGRMVAEKGIVTDPQFCFAAVGDAYSDTAPIQVGEFEADDERAELHLSNIYLEGRGGGGLPRESYELALYFAAFQTRTSAETRSEKGFMFIIGDEGFYPNVSAQQVQQFMGGSIQEDMLTADVAREVQENWHLFLIRPTGIGNYGNREIEEQWSEIMPSQHIFHATLDDILAQISGTISIVAGEGLDATLNTMRESGFSESAIESTSASLGRLAATV